MMAEDYCDIETAKLLKEKGFDEKTLSYYEDGILYHGDWFEWNRSPLGQIAAPSQAMAMKWLREVHNLHIMVNCIGKVNYDPIVQRFDGKDFEIDGVVFTTTKYINSKYINVRRGFKTYEQACEAAIKYCLENVIK